MDIWHVNSTARGGGVAEILTMLVSRADTGEIRHHRFVTPSDPSLFNLTKRLHHRLHGRNAGPLPTAAEDRAYTAYGHRCAQAFFAATPEPGIVVLHDPQTLPMAPLLAAAGLPVAWRCHIGTAAPNTVSRETWHYLRRFWTGHPVLIFSDPLLVPAEAQPETVRIIPPSIDLTAPKNTPLGPAATADALRDAGLAGVPDDEPVILQVARWDPLKDMTGVLRAYAESALPSRARLVLCGPSPAGIVDDPEAADVFAEVRLLHQQLPPGIRNRVHLTCPDLGDEARNASTVNALQRRATVVVQKSREEGFGLTVTEAMAKGRPVVASRVGGLARQIEHGRTGLLLDDPDDLPGFADLIGRLLDQPRQAAALATAGQAHAVRHYTSDREIRDHHRLYAELAATTRPATPAGLP
ncbi:glycosyltransferase [Actinoplanes sp. NPDC026670]|uniref:glycosyltransferase n=1 Tax=Actinoplanes sp. NPDC026670 TaxID=3154700 RepID=UPI0033E84BF1